MVNIIEGKKVRNRYSMSYMHISVIDQRSLSVSHDIITGIRLSECY
jgi:hypothetical protein